MKITGLKVDHIENPLGFDLTHPTFSFVVEEALGNRCKKARIRVARNSAMDEIVYDSGWRKDISPLAFVPEISFDEGRRYYWEAEAVDDLGDAGKSETSWFEGGLPESDWKSPWITAPFDQNIHPVLLRSFRLKYPLDRLREARLYITGLGLYEGFLNGNRIGNEYMTPFCNDYRYWIQYQTYDVLQDLTEGENEIAVLLGMGWYRWRVVPATDAIVNLFGDRFALSARLRLVWEDGQTQEITTDEQWKATRSPVLFSSIYDGEVFDSTVEIFDAEGRISRGVRAEACHAVETEAPQGVVRKRLSLPVVIRQRLVPVRLIITPKGEQVLDFGQEVTGWMEFDCDLPHGKKVYLQYGEILQDDCFYRDNLRSAKAEYTYIANGKRERVRPRFTFYGFRYVKVEGMPLDERTLRDHRFEACVVYSDLDRTGFITTSNAKLNKLIENTVWGQKGNFLDVPTDCPQRDERCGWTGDAQIFCAAASYHMDTAAFFRKYLFDMREEQRHCRGVPSIVPDVFTMARKYLGLELEGPASETASDIGSSAWGDAATIIPWTLYRFYGDRTLLAETYENMKMWADSIIFVDETYCGGQRLWKTGIHFGDWLALDNSEEGGLFGKTDPHYIASVYYYYSVGLTARAAAVLKLERDRQYYEQIAKEVKKAICKEYIVSKGRIILDTQTALALAIYFELIPKRYRAEATEKLNCKIIERGMHLDTGFVGTAYLCKALTKAGLTDTAYSLLLQEEYPSWLYEVNMGATTVWERWNSVLPNGKVSDISMNSLNHYAYGAVVEWIYRVVCGIVPEDTQSGVGFRKIKIAPIPDRRLEFVSGEYRSASGTYKTKWRYAGEQIVFDVAVPFGCRADFILPNGFVICSLNGQTCVGSKIRLEKGEHQIVARILQSKTAQQTAKRITGYAVHS